MGRDTRNGPYYVYGSLPNRHQFYDKETKLSFMHMVSWHSMW